MLITGFAKVRSAFGESKLLAIPDPIIGVQFGQLFLVVGPAEIVIALVCFFSKRQGGVALAALPAASPQLVLLERTLPDGCGLEWLRRCQSQMPGLPVVILSPENCAKTLLAALLAGARGYWVKSRDVGALVERLRGVLAGKLGLCDQAEHLLPQAFALLRQRTENQWGLSWREHEIMTSLCRHGTDKEVAKDLGIAAATVHVHLRNTFKKLGVHGRNAAVAKFLLMFPGGGGAVNDRGLARTRLPYL